MDLLETSDTASLGLDEGNLFYAQSWLLVHYLRSRPNADQSLAKTLARYSELVSGSGSATDAFGGDRSGTESLEMTSVNSRDSCEYGYKEEEIKMPLIDTFHFSEDH